MARLIVDVLRMIVDEMQEQLGKVLSPNDQFNLLISSYKWQDENQTPKSFSKNWSNWVGKAQKNGLEYKTGNVNEIHTKFHTKIKKDLEQKLKLPEHFWKLSDFEQGEMIVNHVKMFAKGLLKDDKLPRFELELYPSLGVLSDEQRNFVVKVLTMNSEEVRTAIDESFHLFNDKPVQQPFLRALIPIFYARGYYDLLLDFVFRNLHIVHMQSTEMMLMRAHALGASSDPDRRLEAIEILGKLDGGSKEEQIDRRTGLISNILRYNLENSELDDTKLAHYLELAVNEYTVVFDYSDHYYPGVNLAYMAKLARYIFPENAKYARIDINAIEKRAESSITLDKKSPDSDTEYYASIAEAELKLLCDHSGADSALRNYLKKYKPATSLIWRTERQLRFVDTLMQKYAKSAEAKQFSNNLKNFTEILEDYRETHHRNKIKSKMHSLEILLEYADEVYEVEADDYWIKEVLAAAADIAMGPVEMIRVADAHYEIIGDDNKARELYLKACEEITKTEGKDDQRSILLVEIAGKLHEVNDDTKLTALIYETAHETAATTVQQVKTAMEYYEILKVYRSPVEWIVSAVIDTNDKQELSEIVNATFPQSALVEKAKQSKVDFLLEFTKMLDRLPMDDKIRKQQKKKLLDHATSIAKTPEQKTAISSILMELMARKAF